MKSPRGLDLALWCIPVADEEPVVTVELSVKWYSLFVVSPGPGGGVKEVPFPDMGDYDLFGSSYVDHVPNPRHVMRWAAQEGYYVDELALELMIGRWELEALGHYTDERLEAR